MMSKKREDLASAKGTWDGGWGRRGARSCGGGGGAGGLLLIWLAALGVGQGQGVVWREDGRGGNWLLDS